MKNKFRLESDTLIINTKLTEITNQAKKFAISLISKSEPNQEEEYLNGAEELYNENSLTSEERQAEQTIYRLVTKYEEIISTYSNENKIDDTFNFLKLNFGGAYMLDTILNSISTERPVAITTLLEKVRIYFGQEIAMTIAEDFQKKKSLLSLHIDDLSKNLNLEELLLIDAIREFGNLLFTKFLENNKIKN